MANCGSDSFTALSTSVSNALGAAMSISASKTNEPLILRVLETVRGMMRCALKRGRWTKEARDMAVQTGWSVSTPLLTHCTVIAEQYAQSNMMLVVASCARIWSHFLKIYSAKFSNDNFGGVFSELQRLLATFHGMSSASTNTSGTESIHALVICSFAGLLVQLLMTQKTMIVAAMSRGTGGTTVSSLQTQAKLNWKPNQNHAENQMGDRVINVVFISVTHLFTQITPSLLQFPKVSERFVALSCFLVEMFPERLLSGSTESVNAFCSCLEFAADSTAEDVSSGALDGITSLMNRVVDLNSNHLNTVMTRFVHFYLKLLSKEYSEEIADLFFDSIKKSTDVCRAAVGNWVGNDERRRERAGDLFSSGGRGKEQFRFAASKIRLLKVV